MPGGPRSDRRLVELVAEVMGLLDMAEFRQGLLVALARAFPCKWASLNEVGPDRVVAVVHPHLDDVWFERFAALAHENPIYQHWVRTRDGRAYRFCDVATRAEVEATELYQTIYRPLGIEYQIAITLPNEGDHILAIVLHRTDSEFTDDERDLLNRARPFLIQAYRNALAYSDARAVPDEAIAAGLEAHGLTSREAEVMSLVAFGASNRDIAAHLDVSERTVQKHLERSFRKLRVTNRSRAAKVAWDLARRTAPQLLPDGSSGTAG
jgi:DNA-binding CsgD family transcriptional regulator